MIVFGFVLTIIFGLLVSFLFVPKMNNFERLGLSYVLGIGLQTFFMFILYLFGYDYSLINTLSLLLILTLILAIFNLKSGIKYLNEFKVSVKSLKLSKLEKILFTSIIVLFAYSLISTLYWPVGAWDSLVLYDWRARLFYLTGGMDDAINRGYFFGVPLLTSLSHTWVYMLGGKYPEFIYTLFYGSFMLMFYGALREFSNKVVSAFSLLILATLPDIFIHSTFSYSNFPYTVYFVMSTIYLYIWMIKSKSGYLALSMLLLGLSSWTRTSEPFWIINILCVVMYIILKFRHLKLKSLLFLSYTSIFFAIRQPWVIFENNNLDYDTTVTGKVVEGLEAITSKLNTSHIIEVLMFLYSNFISELYIFILLFVLFFVWGYKEYKKNNSFWIAGMVVGYFALTIIGTYVLSLTFRDWRIGGSVSRMVMFIPPIILYFISISEKLNETYNNRVKG